MTRTALWIITTICMLVPGCGYTTRPPFPSHIHTVYVPIFESDASRRDFEFLLTRELIREIERSTPFKVVNSPEAADSILEGRVKYIAKNVRVENPDNEPRQIQLTAGVDVVWRDRRSGEVLRELRVGPSENRAHVRRSVQYAPELGQTYSTASLQLARQLAQQIVAMMEEPW